MEYTVNSLAQLAGVSARTLRWYDKIGLLCPVRAQNDYRIYNSDSVDRLQQILIYREMGFELTEIKVLLKQSEGDRLAALCRQKAALEEQLNRTMRLIETVENTIISIKEEIPMSDKQKFEGFKKNLVKENEEKYGAEARQKYGDKAVDESNRKMMGLCEEEYAAMTELGKEIISRLGAALTAGERPDGEAGKTIAQMHKEWLCYTWNFYSPEAHVGLAEGYVADERFTAYYDESAGKGAAAFLRDAIVSFCK